MREGRSHPVAGGSSGRGAAGIEYREAGPVAETGRDTGRVVELDSPNPFRFFLSRGSKAGFTPRISPAQIVKKLGSRLDAGDQQVVASTGAGYVEQVSLRVIDLFQVSLISD